MGPAATPMRQACCATPGHTPAHPSIEHASGLARVRYIRHTPASHPSMADGIPPSRLPRAPSAQSWRVPSAQSWRVPRAPSRAPSAAECDQIPQAACGSAWTVSAKAFPSFPPSERRRQGYRQAKTTAPSDPCPMPQPAPHLPAGLPAAGQPQPACRLVAPADLKRGAPCLVLAPGDLNAPFQGTRMGGSPGAWRPFQATREEGALPPRGADAQNERLPPDAIRSSPAL
jgi:hypothetical protein